VFTCSESDYLLCCVCPAAIGACVFFTASSRFLLVQGQSDGCVYIKSFNCCVTIGTYVVVICALDFRADGSCDDAVGLDSVYCFMYFIFGIPECVFFCHCIAQVRVSKCWIDGSMIKCRFRPFILVCVVHVATIATIP
jgi:hypothetical protein